MSPWKNRLVCSVIALSSLSLSIFLLSGGAALYWAWLRADLHSALPYLPCARNSGMLAMVCTSVALGIVFSPSTFPIGAKTRLCLSFLSTATIACFSEFRNEGKFHLKTLVHFFGPGTWIHDGLNQIIASVGDTLYRIEYSHWNDFLMGPAIVSVLFAVAFVKIYGAVQNSAPITLGAPAPGVSIDLDHALRFARILMNVGLFWFFIDAWAEKAGYLSNPHSSDEIDLPVEFAGTMLAFWMVRVLTRPFDRQSEEFRSNLLIDFVASGVMGLFYTLIVGMLTEGIAGAVAHALYPVVPESLDRHEYTPIQQHLRPFELFLLAGVLWWGLNQIFHSEKTVVLIGSSGESSISSKWHVPMGLAIALGAATCYLLIVMTMLSVLGPQGLGWTQVMTGVVGGTAAYIVLRRAGGRLPTTILGANDPSGD